MNDKIVTLHPQSLPVTQSDCDKIADDLTAALGMKVAVQESGESLIFTIHCPDLERADDLCVRLQRPL